jgi:chromosome segregation ATPase
MGAPVLETKQVHEIRQILTSSVFEAWHEEYCRLHDELRSAREQHPDRLVHMVLRAGEFEGRAAQAQADFAALDGSFDQLGEFELQRQRTSTVWIEHQRAEHALTQHRQAASELRTKLQASRKQDRSATVIAEEDRLAGQLAETEKMILQLDAEVQRLKLRLDQAAARRDELWSAVQQTWLEAFRANMARIENDFLGKRARAEISRLSGDQTTGGSGDAETLEPRIGELEQALETLLEEGRRRFDCVLIAEFLYWPHQEDMRAALCVPLLGERDQLNLQVEPLKVYRVARDRGLQFIEPLPEDYEAGETDDARLERFFTGRPTA